MGGMEVTIILHRDEHLYTRRTGLDIQGIGKRVAMIRTYNASRVLGRLRFHAQSKYHGFPVSGIKSVFSTTMVP